MVQNRADVLKGRAMLKYLLGATDNNVQGVWKVAVHL